MDTWTKRLFLAVAALTVLLVIEATTRSSLAAWASMVAVFVVLVIRYELWPGSTSRVDDEE